MFEYDWLLTALIKADVAVSGSNCPITSITGQIGHLSSQ